MIGSTKIHLRHVAWVAAFAVIVAAVFYPSDMDGHYSESKNGDDSALVVGVETYGRHLNSIIPLGTAIVLRDVRGLWQISAIVLSGTAATHIPKRLLNDVEVNGNRLGQRPNGGEHNMPSGHSALASAGAYVAVRRYLKWFGLIVWPILFLTMYARYMLDAHTVSATIAGAIIGVLIADFFARPCFRLRRLMHARKSSSRTKTGPLEGDAAPT
ncbi:MAG: phosphatase PAP2 family protein [Pseudomonadota bacterium]